MLGTPCVFVMVSGQNDARRGASNNRRLPLSVLGAEVWGQAVSRAPGAVGCPPVS